MDNVITTHAAPFTREDFNKVYGSWVHWVWSDFRIPPQLKKLLQWETPNSTLELGCGLGRFSNYVAQQHIEATAVDFSGVAITKARHKTKDRELKPTFLVRDVTTLEDLNGPYELSFDVGCFHCLDAEGQKQYVAALAKQLPKGATHLLWALDRSPSDMDLGPQYMAGAFAKHFELVRSETSRRRLIASHWYWFRKK